jgi:hypothetical protein
MPTIIDCPSCQRKLRLPESLQDRPVQCPTCGTTFTAPAANAGPHSSGEREALPADPPAAPTVAQPEGYALHQGSPPAAAAEGERVFCPSCGAANRPTARCCRMCGTYLKEDDEKENDEEEDGHSWESGRGPRRDAEPHRGPLILTLAIISLVALSFSFCYGLGALVGLPLGLTAWVMGRNDLAKMRKNLMDVQGQSITHAAWVCGIIGTILNGLALLTCGGLILFLVVMSGMH